ncbi:MAG TPA: hypothetical protein VGO99_06595 [Leifsonia sp.]|jgi:DNA-binding transcriptional regulator YbjK|nr:hypothetical protein [Leifsonia sp.]
MSAAITAKGQVRRDALLDAVIRVLERGGLCSVTHRAVANEAGLPLSAATYYFATLDDLLTGALRRATEGQVQLFARLRDGTLADFAEALHRWTHVDRASAIAQYELLLLAMRRDGLREAADSWYRALEEALEATAGVARPQVAALTLDGLVLRMLWRGEPSSVGAIEAALREILGDGHDRPDRLPPSTTSGSSA